VLCFSLISLIYAVPTTAVAQTSGIYRSLGLAPPDSVRDFTGILAKTKTNPLNDAVLPVAPDQITFDFPQTVRLVKLILRNQEREWVDIGFRYDPSSDRNFALALPQLAASTYYIAEWAILAPNERLVKGSFSFSFGPGAEPPSRVKEAEELLRMLDSGAPAIELNEALQPTEIIINREPDVYDPPFTIQLDN